MPPLKKSEVLLMQEDVLVYGFKQVGLPYFQEDDLGDARRLFTSSVGEAVLRFRNANERAYVANVRTQTVKRLLEPSSRVIGDFARANVDNIFANREENYMRFFRYLAFILDLSVFAHRYKKIHLMNPVFVECESMFDAYLSTEEELPFWRNFMSLCDTVLRNSPEHGRPKNNFRNPAVHWDPRDPTFNPDDPGLTWYIPSLHLPPDHPILKPDRQALMNKFWKDVKSTDPPAENLDEGEEYLNLDVETLKLGGETSNLVVQKSNLGGETSNLVVQKSNLGGETSNLVVQKSNLGAETSNLVVQKSNLVAETSNLVVQKSNLGGETSNLVVQKSNLGGETSNLVVQKSNLGAETSNLVVQKSNLGTETLNSGAVNFCISTGADNLNVSSVTTARGDENLNFGDENPNRNENTHPGTPERTDSPDLNPDPHLFDVILAAMQWNIYDAIWNTDPQDPSLDE